MPSLRLKNFATGPVYIHEFISLQAKYSNLRLLALVLSNNDAFVDEKFGRERFDFLGSGLEYPMDGVVYWVAASE
jgi:hypothetical protein